MCRRIEVLSILGLIGDPSGVEVQREFSDRVDRLQLPAALG
jgi:hypothetical protein